MVFIKQNTSSACRRRRCCVLLTHFTSNYFHRINLFTINSVGMTYARRNTERESSWLLIIANEISLSIATRQMVHITHSRHAAPANATHVWALNTPFQTWETSPLQFAHRIFYDEHILAGHIFKSFKKYFFFRWKVCCWKGCSEQRERQRQ